jgi:hypothetical protein
MSLIDQHTDPVEANPPFDATRTLRTDGPRNRGRLLLLALAVLAALAAGAGWVALHDRGASKAKRAPAKSASVQALTSLATSVGHPVYWAGPKAGYRYELTRTTDGRIYIRYLPAGVPVGTAAPDYLTVGTYPVRNALATVRAIGAKSGGSLLNLAGGGLAALDPDHPLSTYIAYPGSGYEIEVYEPSPGVARTLVASGAIIPTSGGVAASVTPIQPTAASIADLRSLAASSGHPVFWAGARNGATYEMSETSDGRIYVRYLPKGVQVGVQQPYLTVGSYPVPDAFSAVNVIAQRPGATQIKLPNGGIAVTDPGHPTSVYMAYPHGTIEVEVFAPSAARAHQLVEGHLVVPVPSQ